ncbi:hypothetical protein [Actinoplanes sp. NPDC051859]|uniref:hypothetical protein n=1 Tax=Actinoplanes sp. NPDC051859 TaxID=3363909 RepID=UPI0037B98A0F
MAELGEMARDLEQVCRALHFASQHFAGVDQADSARQLEERVSYSPLRTLVEQAHETAQRVILDLRKQGTRGSAHDGPE